MHLWSNFLKSENSKILAKTYHLYCINNLSRILTTILVSFNENEFKLQKMADRANSTFNEKQLFITRKLCDGKIFSVIRRSYGTEYHQNTRHEVPYKTAFFRVANRLKTCGNSHSKHPSCRPGYSDEVPGRVTNFFHENDHTIVLIAAEKLNLCYTTVWKILHKKLKWKAYKLWSVQPLSAVNDQLRMDACIFWLTFEEEWFERLIWSNEKWFVLSQSLHSQNYILGTMQSIDTISRM